MPPAAPSRQATKVPEIRKGDTVVVLAGKDAGKRGTVERVVRRAPARSATRSVYRRFSPRGGDYVVVEGLNVAKRHTKPRQTSSQTSPMPQIQPGGILDVPQPLPMSRVMLVCSHCNEPTRVAHRELENGRRVRVCRHCGEQLEASA
ncbi:MAG TPA: 50S ribosomal protein L24 [Candidatus Limnocylindrales bacterium]|nr:50S ribosomal protein L24 [Candidatus Limnocylindrales bacterium]